MYEMPIIVARVFDTRTACSILKIQSFSPKICGMNINKSSRPPIMNIFQHWSVSPVKLQFFRECNGLHKLLGSSLPGKDIVIGFNIIQQLWAKHVIPLSNGLIYNSYFFTLHTVNHIFLHNQHWWHNKSVNLRKLHRFLYRFPH